MSLEIYRVSLNRRYTSGKEASLREKINGKSRVEFVLSLSRKQSLKIHAARSNLANYIGATVLYFLRVNRLISRILLHRILTKIIRRFHLRGYHQRKSHPRVS